MKKSEKITYGVPPWGWNEGSSSILEIKTAGKHRFTITMKKGEAFFDKFKIGQRNGPLRRT